MTRLLVRWFVAAALGALVLGFAPLYGLLTAENRMTPALRAALNRNLRSYDVVVTLSFTPQYFNITTLQGLGTLAGNEGRRFVLLDLSRAKVLAIARFYWVHSVDLAHPPDSP